MELNEKQIRLLFKKLGETDYHPPSWLLGVILKIIKEYIKESLNGQVVKRELNKS